MDFGEAIRALKAGKRVARKGWNGKGMWLRIPAPYPVRGGDGVEGIHTSLPFIEMRTAQGQFVPWLASQTDMLSEDWVEVQADGGHVTPWPQPGEAPKPDMFWLPDEEGLVHDCIGDTLDAAAAFEIVAVQRAKRLPEVFAMLVPVDDGYVPVEFPTRAEAEAYLASMQPAEGQA